MRKAIMTKLLNRRPWFTKNMELELFLSYFWCTTVRSLKIIKGIYVDGLLRGQVERSYQPFRLETCQVGRQVKLGLRMSCIWDLRSTGDKNKQRKKHVRICWCHGLFGIKMNELGSCPRRFILLQVITEIMSLVIIESCIAGMPTPFLFFSSLLKDHD